MTDATDLSAYTLERLLAELPKPISLRPAHIIMAPYTVGYLQTLDTWRSNDRRRIKRELRKYRERYLRSKETGA